MGLFTPVLVFVLLLSIKTIAWGEHGHRTVGYLARMYFTDEGEALFNELVEPTEAFDISDGAVWADNFSVQNKMPFSKPWHYIDAKDDPPTTCKVNYNRDCDADKRCVVSAIVNMTSRVNNPHLPKKEQNNAFKFLLHFLGDITQPLHTEMKCKGGNNLMVQWGDPDSPKEKLHQVWDSLIIKKRLNYTQPRDPDPGNQYDKKLSLAWATVLKSEINHEIVNITGECINIREAEKCALLWANDANAYICSYVLKQGKNLGLDRDDKDCRWEWRGPTDVSKGYYEGAVPIVEEQVAKAGWRLGAWVNALAAQRAAGRRTGVLSDDERFKLQGLVDEL